MTVGEKLQSVDTNYHIFLYLSIALAIIFVIALIISIVLTAKDKRKGIPVTITFISIVLVAISCGLMMRQSNLHHAYDSQLNYFYLKTRVTPHATKKLKLSTFNKDLRKIQKIEQRIQQQQGQP